MSKHVPRILAKIRNLLYSESFSIAIVFVAFGALLISVLVFLFCGNWTISTTLNEEKIGQFGDFSGGFIGTVLAFAASLLYLLALREQRKDVRINQRSLQKQTEEFQNQVSELRQSREAYQKQLRMMQIQQYDSNFFSYFNIYLEVKAAITKRNSQGISPLGDFLNQLSNKLLLAQIEEKDAYGAYVLATYEYCRTIIDTEFCLTHYFRTFYRLMAIASSAPTESVDQKMKYVKIVRSQLTEEELLILYYNSHSRYAGQSRRLLYEYNVLKHLSPLHKYEIKNRFQSLEPSTLMHAERFYDFIYPQIIRFVNLVCDNVEERKTDITYEPLDIQVRLAYVDDIIVTLFSRKHEKVVADLKSIFEYLLFDLLFNSQMQGQKGKIQRSDSILPNTDFEQTDYRIDSTLIQRIVVDKDDE